MKLSTIKPLVEATISAENRILSWARQNNTAFLEHDVVEVLENGSIVYHGDINTSYPPHDFSFHEVTGFYYLKLNQAYHNFPKIVGGDFELHVQMGVSMHIQSSQVPTMSNKKQQYIPKVILDGPDSTIELDDVTSLKTYKVQTIGFGVVSGLSKVAELPKVNILRIKDSYEGIPANLPGLSALLFSFQDGSKLRGLHKVLKSFDAQILRYDTGTPFPILLLLKPAYKAGFASFEVKNTTIGQQIKLNSIIEDAKKQGTDIMDVQEQLIDAGFTEFAKL